MSMINDELRRGDLVEVLTPAAILATLDELGQLEQMPFMPEMAAFCGRRFTVNRRAQKVCDTIQKLGSLRLKDTVLLEDLRCDGTAHGGCQAECRLYWKEAWLRRVSEHDPPAAIAPGALRALIEHTSRRLSEQVTRHGVTQEAWRCQSTCLLQAMDQRLRTFDPMPYVREYACGNVEIGHFLRTTTRALFEESARKMGLIKPGQPPLRAAPGKHMAPQPLNLKPGELVQVKSCEEIAQTLDDKGMNRGLWFDREMAVYCGGTFRVRHRITQFIDERDGRMVNMKSDAVTLEDVFCRGDLSPSRWFCPRGIYPFWREAWLKRAEAAPPSGRERRPATEPAGDRARG
jgi:hypothetical protein